jgi:hypothetical protein
LLLSAEGALQKAWGGAKWNPRGDARDYEALEFYILRHLMGIK